MQQRDDLTQTDTVQQKDDLTQTDAVQQSKTLVEVDANQAKDVSKGLLTEVVEEATPDISARKKNADPSDLKTKGNKKVVPKADTKVKEETLFHIVPKTERPGRPKAPHNNRQNTSKRKIAAAKKSKYFAKNLAFPTLGD